MHTNVDEDKWKGILYCNWKNLKIGSSVRSTVALFHQSHFTPPNSHFVPKVNEDIKLLFPIDFSEPRAKFWMFTTEFAFGQKHLTLLARNPFISKISHIAHFFSGVLSFSLVKLTCLVSHWNEATILWNEVTVWWNDVTKGWNEVTGYHLFKFSSDPNCNEEIFTVRRVSQYC